MPSRLLSSSRSIAEWKVIGDQKTISGVEMFIRQAMAQYKLFTGSEADEEIMRKTVLNCL